MRKAIRILSVLLILSMLALPVSAATGSATQPGAPAVEVEGTTTTTSSSTYYAPAEKAKVEVTAMVDMKSASKEVKAAMEEANKTLEDGNLTKVEPLVKALETIETDIKAEDLAISELFYVKLNDAAEKELKKDGEITLTIKAKGIEKDQFLVVMVFVDGEWVVVEAENVEITKNGEVKVTVENVGPIAFVVEKA